MKLYLILLASILLFGCASAAKVNNMSETNVSDVSFEDKNKQSIYILNVTGGSITSVIHGGSQVEPKKFQEALEISLLKYNLSSNETNSKFGLSVTILEQSMPNFGTGITSKTRVQYVVTEKDSGNIIFDQEISASYTAAFSDALFALKRGRLAKEGAVKKNIEDFITELDKLL